MAARDPFGGYSVTKPRKPSKASRSPKSEILTLKENPELLTHTDSSHGPFLVEVALGDCIENVAIDPEKGPVELDSNGYRCHRMCLEGAWEVTKRQRRLWKDMGTTDREILVIFTARRNASMRNEISRIHGPAFLESALNEYNQGMGPPPPARTPSPDGRPRAPPRMRSRARRAASLPPEQMSLESKGSDRGYQRRRRMASLGPRRAKVVTKRDWKVLSTNEGFWQVTKPRVAQRDEPSKYGQMVWTAFRNVIIKGVVIENDGVRWLKGVAGSKLSLSLASETVAFTRIDGNLVEATQAEWDAQIKKPSSISYRPTLPKHA
eukprot:gnl/TRDRNA2_/TRDRNA2_127817_c0_seq2.p1 gnl/TRDRNA2_/TRDRNA2_127817_c0~~gnl/TRDRNA2_/TRDRNA2_127817_c0_seq2.p1  ORF type:complete len:321 (-),score=27.63 gnl/TRDRNA2_/TRDRNA2_127817_c0_seq2:345-1307(-)